MRICTRSVSTGRGGGKTYSATDEKLRLNQGVRLLLKFFHIQLGRFFDLCQSELLMFVELKQYGHLICAHSDKIRPIQMRHAHLRCKESDGFEWVRAVRLTVRQIVHPAQFSTAVLLTVECLELERTVERHEYEYE